mgnify:CR=1 FL=1
MSSSQKSNFSLVVYISRTKAKKNGEVPVLMKININGERVVLLKKTLKSTPVRRSKLTPLRRGNLTPSKQSIWSMFNSEVYIFNCRISRGSILVRRRRDDLADYSKIRNKLVFFLFFVTLKTPV